MKQLYRLIKEEHPKRFSWKTRLSYGGLDFYITKKNPDGRSMRIFYAYLIPSMILVRADIYKDDLIAMLVTSIDEIKELLDKKDKEWK